MTTPTPLSVPVEQALADAIAAYLDSNGQSGDGHKLLRRALTALHRDQWQPIETAPKDGTGILVVDMNAPSPGVGMAWFVSGKWSGDDPEAPRGEEDCTSYWPTPTHWRPLPTPPSSQVQP